MKLLESTTITGILTKRADRHTCLPRETPRIQAPIGTTTVTRSPDIVPAIQLQYNEVRTFPTWNWNPELIQSIQALQNIRLFSRVSTVSHRLKEFAPPAAAGTKLNDASTPLRPCRRRRCLAAGLFSFHSRNFRMGLTAHQECKTKSVYKINLRTLTLGTLTNLMRPLTT